VTSRIRINFPVQRPHKCSATRQLHRAALKCIFMSMFMPSDGDDLGAAIEGCRLFTTSCIVNEPLDSGLLSCLEAMVNLEYCRVGNSGEVVSVPASIASSGGPVSLEPDLHGRFVHIRGDLEKAKNIVIFVPGMKNGLHTFASSMIPKIDAIVQACEQHPEATANLIEELVAFVTWMDYYPPRSWTAAPSAIPADNGAKNLEFWLGLVRRWIPKKSRIVVVSHSYGTLVSGLCAKSFAFPVEVLVVCGSPGVGSDNRTELTHLLPKYPLFALAHRWDFIAKLAWFGRNPAKRSFGSVLLKGNDTRSGRGDRSWRHAHTSYFEKESTAVDSVAGAILNV